MQPALIRDGNIFHLQGEWIAAHAAMCAALLEEQVLAQKEPSLLDASSLTRLDTTGAWLLIRTLKRHMGLRLINMRPEYAALLEEANAPLPEATAREKPSLLARLRSAYAGRVGEIYYRSLDGLTFIGEFWANLAHAALHPRSIRLRSIVAQAQKVGVMASPLIALISFLIAIVLAYQGAAQLSKFGASIYTVDMVAISVLREMGVLLTAIMVAGRSGSAFAAELGVMKLNEEMDALKTTGLDPWKILVLPRIFALILMMPLLTMLANLTGLLGTGVLSVFNNGMTPLLFLERLQDAASPTHFWAGMIKAPVFGLIIGMVGCYHGLQVSNSAESVGKETTSAVVHAIFLVIFADAAFSIIFTELNI